jgi:single-strand DNA-binding protein
MKLNNKVQLIGNIGMNPEIKTVGDNKTLAKFSIATNDIYKNNKGEKVVDTQWHNIVAWGNTAIIIEKYCEKGTSVAIEGKLMNRSYEDKEGVKRYVTEIIASEVMKLNK